MGLYTKTVLFARRLSAFYLLIIVFSIFFGVFYLKYLPANQEELDRRGFRILNQLARNLQTRDTTLTGMFDNLNGWVNPGSQGGGKYDAQTLGQREAEGLKVQQQIQAQVTFSIVGPDEAVGSDSAKAHAASRRQDSVEDIPNKGWSMVFRMKDGRQAIVRMGDFAEPVLAARDDLFDSYVLLEAPLKDSNRRMKILYLQKQFSPADRLSADSALAMERNTDLAAISDITVGGQPFVLFLQSFELAGKRVELGGLVARSGYQHAAKSLPTAFIVSMVLIIFVGLIVLPFMKIFFISPGENMAKSDVLSCQLAIYLGTGMLVLAGCYFVATYAAQFRVEARLAQVSDELHADIQKDLDAATRQMNGYARAYQLAKYKGVLAYKDYDSNRLVQTDIDFTPRTYPLTARILWYDSLGNTLAKWNPFNFLSPPSSVAGYDYYTDIMHRNADDYKVVLSAGESNITSEFQFFLTRRMRQRISPVAQFNGARGDTAWSAGILLPFYMHCGLQPVLPRGFGFCLIDNKTEQVIMHSDARRNLAENLYLETGENARLRNCVNFRVRTVIRNVSLYGSSHTLFVRPVDGQAISLVVFYDDATHAENIFRLLHFGGETFLYLAILFLVCVWLSSSEGRKPSKLSFELDRVEWVRPVERNRDSYAFNWRFFRGLLAVWVVFAMGVVGLGLDNRLIYYMSMLLPFYAAWGYVAGRKRVKARFPLERPVYAGSSWVPDNVEEHVPFKELHWFRSVGATWNVFVVACKFVVIAVMLLNWYIYGLIRDPNMDQGAGTGWAVALFQAAALGVMGWYFYWVFERGEKKRQQEKEKAEQEERGEHKQEEELEEEQEEGKEKKKKKKEEKKKLTDVFDYSIAYVRSVNFSVLVISFIPALGVLWYGWTVEKLQSARADELFVAGRNKAHMEYIARDMLKSVKHQVRDVLQVAQPGYPQDLLTESGRYLAGETITYAAYRDWRVKMNASRRRDIDEPYITLLDEVFLISAGEYEAYSIKPAAADNSWAFALTVPGTAADSDNLPAAGIERAGLVPSPVRSADVRGAQLGLGVPFGGDPLMRDFVVSMPVRASLFSIGDLSGIQLIGLALGLIGFLWFLPRLLSLSVYRIFLLHFFWAAEPPEGKEIKEKFPETLDRYSTKDFIERDGDHRAPLYVQEGYILDTMLKNRAQYEKIWKWLPEEDRYFVYDFAKDGYTNYKDSATVLRLQEAGVLKHEKMPKDQWVLFSISFREFVLRKKGTREIRRLKEKYSVPGLWATIRMPALVIIAACAILLLMTQESVTHKVTVAITSMGAIVPIVMEITRKVAGKGAS